METIYSVDFEKVPKEKASVSAMDRGFLYGDSIYEAVRTYEGKLFLAKDHYDRLVNSASRLKFQVPFSLKKLEDHLNELIKGLNYDLYIRIIVTRGEDQVFDLNPAREFKPKTVIMMTKIHEYPPEFYTKGINLSIVSILRNPKNSLDPEIKSGNYLNNVLAVIEAKQKGANDALMINGLGFITESTTSNFFIVKKSVAITPKRESGILHGVTRHLLMGIMKANKISYEESDITPKDVYACDECFITATTKEIMPVTIIDGKKIGDGKVGKTTKLLMGLFKKEVSKILGIEYGL